MRAAGQITLVTSLTGITELLHSLCPAVVMVEVVAVATDGDYERNYHAGQSYKDCCDTGVHGQAGQDQLVYRLCDGGLSRWCRCCVVHVQLESTPDYGGPLVLFA